VTELIKTDAEVIISAAIWTS